MAIFHAFTRLIVKRFSPILDGTLRKRKCHRNLLTVLHFALANCLGKKIANGRPSSQEIKHHHAPFQYFCVAFFLSFVWKYFYFSLAGFCHA